MGAAVVEQPGTVSVATVADPGAVAASADELDRPEGWEVFVEVSACGICGTDLHSFGRAVELMARGVIDAATIISHHFALDQYPEALATFRAGTGRKLQVCPWEGLVEGRVSSDRRGFRVAERRSSDDQGRG
jgi:threonine dehydrogenase-like Zn-dependent dehydrogenase